MKPAELSFRELLANAHVLADTLRHEGRPGAAGLVDELVARVVPVNLVPSRGAKIQAAPVIIPQKAEANGFSWCDQCEHRVKHGCGNRFCKVAA